MGFRALLERLFPPPPPSVVIERYLKSGKDRWIDELFDGWVNLDNETFGRLMAIHEHHGGSGLYGGLLKPAAQDDLAELAADLRHVGK